MASFDKGILAQIGGTILGDIVAVKMQELQQASTTVSFADMQALARDAMQANPVRGFARALAGKINSRESAVIAEIKKASPSKGVIRQDFDVASLAATYTSSGAACLSVLTDVQFFAGHNSYVQLARNASPLPVIRKDFMINHYHIAQSRALGADAVLLIAACLDDVLLQELYAHACELGMDVLMEVHDSEELERVLATPNRLIGINNRNLKTFTVDLAQTHNLRAQVPSDRLLITESGIVHPDDVRAMHDHGVYGFLVGESLMRSNDVAGAYHRLFGA
jgi:indole-3-glycerol phosphate synthase